MARVTGPRQVGKSTVCAAVAGLEHVLNWDNVAHRAVILAGPEAVAARLGLDRLRQKPGTITFDELHKFAKWKAFLKGFFGTHSDRTRI